MTIFQSRASITVTLGIASLALLALIATACNPTAGSATQPGSGSTVAVGAGDVQAGRKLLIEKGCGACHTARGVPEATGSIGPALTGLAGRPKIADTLPNTPENLKKWISNPPWVKPGTMMPSLSLSDKEADDLVAFLGTLK